MKTSIGTAYDWLIREPRTGAWRARLTMDLSPDLAVGASIVLADVWAGTVDGVDRRGTLAAVSVVGGANRLAASTRAQFYVGGASARSILADLCGAAGELAGDVPDVSLASWRTRGLPLAAELDRVARSVSAGQWRIGPDGKVAIGQSTAPDQPTGPNKGTGDYAKFEIASPSPCLDIATHDLALYQRGKGVPSVGLFPLRPIVPRFDPQVVGGRIDSQAGAKVNVTLDDGTALLDLPLFVVPGYEPGMIVGARCLVLDLADDPRNTIALAGVDGTLQSIKLAGGGGRFIRHGDKISINGLLAPSGGGPVTATPAGTILQLDPTVLIAPGPPGIGHSKVEG
jgi:hypothetical protein